MKAKLLLESRAVLTEEPEGWWWQHVGSESTDETFARTKNPMK